MTKLEVQQRVLKNGEPLALDNFQWDKETNTFSSNEYGLVLDFNGIDNCTFTTGSNCTFKTDHSCVIIRRDSFQVIQPNAKEIITTCPYGIKGYISKKENQDKFYLNGDESLGEHIIKDGILSKVISKKGNVYKVINNGDYKESYLVTNGTEWSHGKTIKQAKEDLVYKISSRDTSAYDTLKLDTMLTKEEAIKMYMVITGACSLGTKTFIDSIETKDEYSVKDVIEITKGRYGNETLVEFFKEKGLL